MLVSSIIKKITQTIDLFVEILQTFAGILREVQDIIRKQKTIHGIT